MTPTTARFVHASVLAGGVTGVVYGWMRYLLEPVDEFAVVHHPAEPLWKDLHVLLVPLLVFACALVWRAHVWARIRSGFRERRRTGIVLAALFPPMVASGYLLQAGLGASLRELWVWTHGLTAACWISTYGVHQLGARHTR